MRLLALLLLILAPAANAAEPALQENPALVERVAAGQLPPLAERLPSEPLVVDVAGSGRKPGVPGGTLHMLIGQGGDARVIQPFGYARLMIYDESYNLVPDILDRLEIKDNRNFTLHLRAGHRWSDGAPFTAEDFRYYWDDVLGDPALTPDGPPPALLVNGQPPQVEILDATTIRYSWPFPNQAFVPALAGADPLVIYRPAHYLKQFDPRYAAEEELGERVAAAKLPSWVELYQQRDTSLTLTNPDMPTLQPWVITAHAPAKGIEMRRNLYYHRIDKGGRQLPYIGTIL